MAEGTSKIHVVNTLLLLGVLVTTTTMTCSNDRLEGRVIKIEKRLESGGPASAAAAPTGGAPTGAARAPGQPTPYSATGWGGKTAQILYVEGAVPDAPLTLAQKPRPQNDWYVMQWGSAAKTLNYYTSNEGEIAQIIKYIVIPMIGVDPDHPPGVVPYLATSWDVADDKLTYTFHLRRGVLFADGRPFSSADVKFSFDVVRDQEVGAAHLAPGFEDVESVSTPDPYTVVVKYKKKYWKGLYQFGFSLRVLNKAWYEEQIPLYAKKLGEEKWSTEPGKPGFGTVFRKIRMPCPGAGPYYIAKDEDYSQERVILTQNPFYYGIQVHPTWWNFVQVRRVYIKDEVAVDEAFRKQEFDVMSVAHDRWEEQLKNDPIVNRISKHYLYDHTGLDTSIFVWNCRKDPFDDKRVRQAMTMLLDRQWIIDKIYRGNATPAVCRSKRSYPSYSPELQPYPFDIEKAKALLTEAGWRDTDGDGILDRNGKRFEFALKSSTGGGAASMRIIGAFQDACKKAGIRVDNPQSEWSTFIDDFDQRRFDAAFLNFSWGDPWIDLYEEAHSSQDVPGGQNAPGWHNKRVDELVSAMREEFDENKRNAMFHEFNKLFYEDQPITLFAHPLVSVCQNKRFEGVHIRPTGLQFFDMWVKPENVLHK
jgi:peptide/nickel transport system substrate-binding protein